MKKAFTLVEILIVVAIIGLLAAVGVPSFLGARQGAETHMQEVNVSAVNQAKDQWAVVNNQPAGTEVTWADIAQYIGNGVTSQDGLMIGNKKIVLEKIGTTAHY